MRIQKTVIVGIIALSIIWMGASVFAHGRGWDKGGYGWSQRSDNGGSDYQPPTDEEFKMLRDLRDTFYHETKEIRDSIIDKQRELQSLLAQEVPDMESASQIQNEISVLRSELDQKRLSHMVEIKKLFPNMERGFMGGGHRGGGMRGSGGPRGGGWCW